MGDYKEYVTDIHPFRSMPRQIGIFSSMGFFERRECVTPQQFFYILNLHNGVRRKLFYSIYRVNQEGTFDNVIIDCLGFDLDSEKRYENLKKIYNWCKAKNLRAIYLFSSSGFWVFIKTNAIKLKNPKEALANAQRYVAEQVGLTIGKSKECDLDSTCIGDIARVTRAIGSKDTARNRFCITLRESEIFSSYEDICALSTTFRKEYYYHGDETFDMTPFDTEAKIYKKHDLQALKDVIPTTSNSDVDAFIKLPCVKQWLTNPSWGVYQARYFFAVYCKEELIPPEKCEEFAQKYFSQAPRTDRLKNNYEHWKKDRTMKKGYQEDKPFPTCVSICSKGLCPGKCSFYSEHSPTQFRG